MLVAQTPLVDYSRGVSGARGLPPLIHSSDRLLALALLRQQVQRLDSASAGSRSTWKTEVPSTIWKLPIGACALPGATCAAKCRNRCDRDSPACHGVDAKTTDTCEPRAGQAQLPDPATPRFMSIPASGRVASDPAGEALGDAVFLGERVAIGWLESRSRSSHEMTSVFTSSSILPTWSGAGARAAVRIRPKAAVVRCGKRPQRGLNSRRKRGCRPSRQLRRCGALFAIGRQHHRTSSTPMADKVALTTISLANFILCVCKPTKSTVSRRKPRRPQ